MISFFHITLSIFLLFFKDSFLYLDFPNGKVVTDEVRLLSGGVTTSSVAFGDTFPMGEGRGLWKNGSLLPLFVIPAG